jgi:hypothetical protein
MASHRIAQVHLYEHRKRRAIAQWRPYDQPIFQYERPVPIPWHLLNWRAMGRTAAIVAVIVIATGLIAAWVGGLR